MFYSHLMQQLEQWDPNSAVPRWRKRACWKARQTCIPHAHLNTKPKAK